MKLKTLVRHRLGALCRTATAVPAADPSDYSSSAARARWVALCRDIAGRRKEVVVTPTVDGRIALIVPAGQVAVLDLLAAGRLRGALRDVAYALDDPETAHLHRHSVPVCEPPAFPVARPRPEGSRVSSSLPAATGSVSRGRSVTA